MRWDDGDVRYTARLRGEVLRTPSIVMRAWEPAVAMGPRPYGFVLFPQRDLDCPECGGSGYVRNGTDGFRACAHCDETGSIGSVEPIGLDGLAGEQWAWKAWATGAALPEGSAPSAVGTVHGTVARAVLTCEAALERMGVQPRVRRKMPPWMRGESSLGPDPQSDWVIVDDDPPLSLKNLAWLAEPARSWGIYGPLAHEHGVAASVNRAIADAEAALIAFRDYAPRNEADMVFHHQVSRTDPDVGLPRGWNVGDYVRYTGNLNTTRT